MFDHVKCIKEWTKMACHVYDAAYCKVMTIAISNMQLEDTKAQCMMWRELNNLRAKNSVKNINFKGFMVDNTQANWKAVQIIYGSGEPRVYLSPLLDYIAKTIQTKVYQAKYARPIQPPLQAIYQF